MKYLAFCLLMMSQFAHANYAVGRALPNQNPNCGTLLYTGLHPTVEGHPQTRIPEVLQVLDRAQKVNFKYVSWHRSYDSIITVFKADNGDQILLDDACYTEGTLVACFHYKGCLYRANAL